MYHGNVVATLLCFLVPRRQALVWNIRHSLYDLSKEKRMTRLFILFNKWLSYLPDKIIYNSYKSRMQHETFGFNGKQSVRICNGVDLEQFCPPTKTFTCNFPWWSRTSITFALVARYHPMKDHSGFINSALLICRQRTDVCINFVLVGKNIDESNDELISLIPAEFREKFFLLGESNNVEKILKSIDCIVLSSAWGEGFPNILIEAMATNLLCISTDVGDSKEIIGRAGIVVPKQNAKALTNAMLSVINSSIQERLNFGHVARERVESNFSIGSVVDLYAKLYDELLLDSQKFYT